MGKQILSTNKVRAHTDLHVAFDKIEGGDGHVGEATAQDPSNRAYGIELRGIHGDLLPYRWFAWSSNREASGRRRRRRRRRRERRGD